MPEQTERLGVSQLEYYFSQEGWLFREQLIHDYGIDAQVEIVDGACPTGSRIAIQIKSGASYFSEETQDAYVFRINDSHIKYWTRYVLPVILVLYHPEQQKLLWQVVNSTTVVKTGKNWKILVPQSKELGASSFNELRALTQPEPYLQKLSRFRFDKPWIEKIENNLDVYVEFEDWINKSLPRYSVRIICDEINRSWPVVYGPGLSITELLNHYFPWADFEMDLDTHRGGCESQYEAEWFDEPEGIAPSSSDGECDYYRFRLELNDVGRSFLELDKYLNVESDFMKRTFTIDDIRRELKSQ